HAPILSDFPTAPCVTSVITISQILQISISEEMLFRGLIMGYFRKSNVNFIVANVVQTILFLLGHLNPFK
ncbi:MAG TPA: CPBP family intramembrane metalloprotease, partial [Candidatus Hydrogenedentes bacterium]|nr:CPBP family intramembrane metalloprotease [Candidatus Hydrogenedentota bacterium]